MAAAMPSCSGRPGVCLQQQPQQLQQPQHHHVAPSHGRGAPRHICRHREMNGAAEFSLWRGETPVPKDWRPSVVPGVRTVATPLLSADKVVERLVNAVHPVAAMHYGAFFTSELGGIVTDPAFMQIHMDDHMVHRGHGVFDTVLITDGHLYQLPQHVARLKESAARAGIEMWRPDEVIMRVLLDTAAASRKINGIIKFWMTPGRGGFGLSPSECTEVGFYALATSESVPKMDALDRIKGFRAIVSSVTPNKGSLAKIKSNNYLRNTMALMEANEAGADVGLFVDPDTGFVQEGPNMNVAIITQDDVLVSPPLDDCLSGITLERLIELIPAERVRSPGEMQIKDIQFRQLTVADLLGAKEAFMTGSTLRVMPLISVGDESIGDGHPGIQTLALDGMLQEDMTITDTKPTTQHIRVPFGRTTGMLEQLQ